VYNNTIVFVAAGTIDITNFGALSLFDDTKPKLYTCGFGVADSFGVMSLSKQDAIKVLARRMGMVAFIVIISSGPFLV
jgi:hypothetical protein